MDMGKEKINNDDLKDQLEYDECPQCHAKVKEFDLVRDKSHYLTILLGYLFFWLYVFGGGRFEYEKKYRCPYCGYVLGEE